MVILAGKIAGEKSELGLFTHKKDDAGKMTIDSLVASQPFNTKDYSHEMSSIIEVFLRQHYHPKKDIYGDIYGACFGIAAPVKNREADIDQSGVKVTITEEAFQQKLPCPIVPICFINDMEAIGYGIFYGNGEDNLTELYKGNYQPKREDNRVLMLVSGGLGQALWYWDEKQEGLLPIPSEGGHIDFGARIDRDIELLIYLKEQKKKEGDHSPVSYEYVLSIPGLVRIYAFLQNIPEGNSDKDANAIIEAARQGDSLCKNALDMFISIWGAQAGNLALTYKAQGGVYIGGISIPIETLKEGTFINTFTDKEGNFRSYNQGISVKVFEDPDIVLWGAARYAINEGFVTEGKFAIMRANQ